MRSLFLIMCITFYTYFLNAQNLEFVWLNKDRRAYEKIDLAKGEIWSKPLTGNYALLYKIEIQKLDLRDVPLDVDIQVNGFNVNKNITYFTMPGTGMVFLLNRTLHTFTRIDETFYRGYNFQATQFFYKGKLYSLGGSGFWNVHSTLTYYDFNRKEWEMVDTKGAIKPERIYSWHAGYNPKLQKVYALESSPEYQTEVNPVFRFFELDVRTLTWTFKGLVDLSKFSKYNISRLDMTYFGDFFYLNPKSQSGLIVDPEKNELLIYQGPKKLFWGLTQKNFEINGYVYSLMPRFTSAHSVDILDSIPLKDIRKYFVVKDTFYDAPLFPWDWKDFALGLMSLVIIGGTMKVIQVNAAKPKSKKFVVVNSEKSVWDLLPINGLMILDFVIEHGCDYLFSTEEISKILGCDKKAFDTQRQYRSKFISNFNTFFEEHFHISNAIYRITSEEDKRFVCYQISEQVVKAYRSYLKSQE
ncbi:MAG: hypothetical protein RI995_74 [Bacteroidota bacterium]